MIVAAITLIAILSVCALYIYETTNVRLHRQRDPTRSGRDPNFARLREHDWWDQTLTSSELARH